MPVLNHDKLPLVSLIIPCFNQAHYLKDAIESIVSQNYGELEIIVVNDGSTDDTEEVAKSHKEVKYIYQVNAGLSAARNKGIEHSSGEYLIFLDSDDVLLPGSIASQIQMMREDKAVAFISGGYVTADANLKILWESKTSVSYAHFKNFLLGNFIGMHAAVIYRRFVFNEFSFDPELKACEDYDLYLKIASKYDVRHHTIPIAIYRRHEANMSANLPVMFSIALSVLEKNYKANPDIEFQKVYERGRRNWMNYYCREMYYQLVGKTILNREYKRTLVKMLLKHRPDIYLRYQVKKAIIFSKGLNLFATS